LKLTVKRGSETRDYSVVTEKLESQVGEEWAFEKWGLSVRKVSRTYAREHQLKSSDGVVVIGVQPGYPASIAGVNRGDVITKVNQQPLETLDVLKRAHTAYEEKPEAVLVEVMRNRQISLVVFKP
jgi:serine protease Do